MFPVAVAGNISELTIEPPLVNVPLYVAVSNDASVGVYVPCTHRYFNELVFIWASGVSLLGILSLTVTTVLCDFKYVVFPFGLKVIVGAHVSITTYVAAVLFGMFAGKYAVPFELLYQYPVAPVIYVLEGVGKFAVPFKV